MSKHLVFVYGSLLKGLHNHSILSNSKFLGEFITDHVFTMISLGSFPGVIDTGTSPIVGEVFEVTDETLKRLDVLEGVPRFYKRKTITIPFHGDAIIYVLNQYNACGREDIIYTGDWKSFYNHQRNRL